jgi:hypothetical protein
VAYGTILGSEPATVSIYGPDGGLVRRTDLPLLQKPPEDKTDRWEEISFVTLVPQSICAVVFAVRRHFGDPVPSNVIAILLLSAAGYATISVAMLRARHAGRQQVYIWVLLAAALGLSGILLLMSMLEDVKSIRCSSCGKRRLVTESVCPHCRALAAPPLMQGIEIFEAVVAAS